MVFDLGKGLRGRNQHVDDGESETNSQSDPDNADESGDEPEFERAAEKSPPKDMAKPRGKLFKRIFFPKTVKSHVYVAKAGNSTGNEFDERS